LRQPKRATQTVTITLATASAVISETGNASGQRACLSVTVRQYRDTDETGSGLTRSICTEKKGQGKFEATEKGPHVPRYLGTLAGCTCACPRTAIIPQSRPHKPLGHQLEVNVGPGVATALEVVTDLVSQRSCYERTRLWSECPFQE
jgi:hypothetical protein